MAKILVTAGSTVVMIDKVRMISNIFKGKTGARIAEQLANEHDVTLLTSNLCELPRFSQVSYRTFDDLAATMKRLIVDEQPDVIVHSAAVSDYRPVRAFVREGGKEIEVPLDAKVSSSHSNVCIEMEPTFKIIDQIRKWGFKGFLVKFKLEVGISDAELVQIAEDSRRHSDADMIVANTLDEFERRAVCITDIAIHDMTWIAREEIATQISEAIKQWEWS